MNKVKQYEDALKSLVDQAKKLQKSHDLLDRAEARGMFRAINVLVLVLDNNVRDGVTLTPVTAKDFVDIAEQDIDNQCPVIGDQLNTVGELRSIISHLDDQDQICIETCDEHGDQIDLFMMAVDVIEGIRLTDDTIVREVRFCQRPNAEPDTRDRTELVEALMQEYREGNESIIELLKTLPWEILKMKLPPDQRNRFDTIKADTNVQETEKYRQELIAKVMIDNYGDNEPETSQYINRMLFLKTKSNHELRNMLSDSDVTELEL